MIDFSNVRGLTIPEGEVSMIARGSEILWQKQNRKYKVELEYLEGTGTQYIKTGVVFKNTDECYADAAMLETGSDKYFVAPSVWNNKSNRFSLGGTYSYFTCAYGSATTSNTHYTPLTIPDNSKHSYSYKNKVFSIGDLGLTMDATSITWGDDTTELLLFYGYNKNTKSRIYFYRQIREGELIIDLIPVLDWNNVPCMYDKVTDELFYNAGTGEFLYA